MKFLISVFIVIIFVSLFVVAQPYRIQTNNGILGTIISPCPLPSLCLACDERCNTNGCDSEDCAQCNQDNCNDIPIDGGLVWLLIAGIGLKMGHFVNSKRSGKQGLKG